MGASMKHPQQGWLTLCRDHWHAMSAITLVLGRGIELRTQTLEGSLESVLKCEEDL